jgi:ribonuclease P protein component
LTRDLTAAEGFPSFLRLHRPQEFQDVLRDSRDGAGSGRRLQGRGRWFMVAARPNGLGHSRLGIIAARRAIPLAVARNRQKRLIREVFRATHARLPGLDVVVRVAKPAEDRGARQAAREELVKLLLAVVQ